MKVRDFLKILGSLFMVVYILEALVCYGDISMPGERRVDDKIRALADGFGQNEKTEYPGGWQVLGIHPVEGLFREHVVLFMTPRNLLQLPPILRTVIVGASGKVEWLTEEGVVKTLEQEKVISQTPQSRMSLAIKIMAALDNYSPPKIISNPNEIPGYKTGDINSRWKKLVSPVNEKLTNQGQIWLNIFAWFETDGRIFHYQFVFENGKLADINRREIARDVGKFTRRQ